MASPFTLGPLPGIRQPTSGDLADMLGIELADTIENQYRIFFRVRYYVDLMTQLWFAPVEIDGRAEIQEGFKNHIVTNLNQAGEHFSEVQLAIDEAKKAMIPSEPAKRSARSRLRVRCGCGVVNVLSFLQS